MEISAAVAADLALLEDTGYDPGTDDPDPGPDPGLGMRDTVLGVAAAARVAVASFLGLTVTLTGHASVDRVVLRFTLWEDDAGARDVGSSFRLPPPAADPADPQPGVAVVLYAGTPGAFVDMAADHSYATGRASADADLDQHRGLALVADVTGVLGDDRMINEAIGVLLGRGRTREQAVAEIDALAEGVNTADTIHATATATATATAAATILATLTPDGPDHPPHAVPGADHH